MNETVLKEILAEICEEEIEELSKFPPFKPSLRHRYAMTLIFASFGKRSGKPPRASKAQRGPSRLSTRLVILIAVIVGAALLTGAILVYISKSFHGKVSEDNTQLFAINMENCPETIEYEYYLPEPPEGFEIVDHGSTSFEVYTKYKNDFSGQTIMLSQWVKKEYSPHYNTEGNYFEEIKVNGHEGVYIYISDIKHARSIVIWDNDDYILELVGELPKNTLINLAKSAKIREN